MLSTNVAKAGHRTKGASRRLGGGYFATANHENGVLESTVRVIVDIQLGDPVVTPHTAYLAPFGAAAHQLEHRTRRHDDLHRIQRLTRPIVLIGPRCWRLGKAQVTALRPHLENQLLVDCDTLGGRLRPTAQWLGHIRRL